MPGGGSQCDGGGDGCDAAAEAPPDAVNESAYEEDDVVGAATGFDPPRPEIAYDLGLGGPISCVVN